MRTKTHLNVGTIGHIDHGKTTLTAANLAVQAARGLARPKTYGDIAKGGTVRDATKVVTITTSHVEYETETRNYAHVDCRAPCLWVLATAGLAPGGAVIVHYVDREALAHRRVHPGGGVILH